MVDTGHSEEVGQPLKTTSVESAFQGESDTEDEDVADLEAEKGAENSEISESPENSVLKNQPSPHLLLSENSAKPLQDQEKAKANVYPPPPYPQHVLMLNADPWQGSFNFPHESLGLEDLWNSQVRLKPSSEEAPKLELKPVPDHLGYTYLGESYTLPIITAANLSEIEEDKLLRILRVEHHGKLYPIMKEGVKEEIIKWPMFGVHSTLHPNQMVLLYNSQLTLSQGFSTENSATEKLDEFCHQAYEYKEQVKRWHDRHLSYKALHPP